MIGRRQLTVAAPISPAALVRAAYESFHPRTELEARAAKLIGETFNASTVLLTDSGTSALVLALRLTKARFAGVEYTVGFPGYACVDLAAAARFAGVRVRLYDIDPVSLSPDLDSVAEMLSRGVNAVVVSHLFGYGADVEGIRSLVAGHGIPLIEDAAQGAGGTIRGQRLGSFGDLSVLSFGRGKGLCAGGGGALLTSAQEWGRPLESLALSPSGRGWPNLLKTAAQWAMGRPSIYALPAAIPWLHLGEMVYHPATEPTAMPAVSDSLLVSALDMERADLENRRRVAAMLADAAQNARDLRTIRPISGMLPGYLRFPVRDLSGRRALRSDLGVTRPYPTPVGEQVEMQPVLASGEPSLLGASDLARSLHTLPTHRLVTSSDISAIRDWLTA
jgi:dTDP-4-amino-4,6-dideoxygalactose transaminase